MAWFVVFAVTAFALWFWREYRVHQQHLDHSSAPHRTGERYIGQVVTVPDGIQDGSARVKLGARQWRVRGPDVPAGARVRITGVDGSVLIVDRVPG